tara:strand:- start:1662 stop:1898 length:237 start_codon:yes stop_codon:yes gene_type:complete
LNKELKKKIFSELADWIIENEPIYPTNQDCEQWIKKNSQYLITKNDKKEISMLLKYLPMSQQMNNLLYAKYLDQIMSK